MDEISGRWPLPNIKADDGFKNKKAGQYPAFSS
jgi:hypothetical protein